MRWGTAIGAGILIAAGADYLYGQLAIFESNQAWTLWLRAGIPLLLMVGLGLVTYWVVGVNRTASDFMIATEGEMKKVSWSTRREIVGATKVVIAFTFMLAAFLFVVDLLFMFIFSAIGVLQEAPSIWKMIVGGEV